MTLDTNYMKKCLFCTNPTDNSDEHIILNSLNGRLHSKEIICSDCNNFFGSNLDNIAKRFFNPILLALDFKNAKGIEVESVDSEDKYLIQKDKPIRLVRPKIQEHKVGNKTLISISGERKHAEGLMERKIKEMSSLGIKMIAKKEKAVSNSIPLSYKVDFKTKYEFNILLNKIALEYCYYLKLQNFNPEPLASNIRALNDKLTNVSYLEQVIRKPKSDEITHLILLKKIDSKLIVYIELFNVLNATIVVTENYEGEDIEAFYYQDAITGEKFDSLPNINYQLLNQHLQKQQNSETDISELVNGLFERKREIDFKKIMDNELNRIKDKLEEDLKKQKITKEQYNDLWLEKSLNFIAELSVEFPYIIEDMGDNRGDAYNDDLNFYHSNIRKEQFEEFHDKHKQLLGKKISEIEGDSYIIEKFEITPIAKPKGIEVVRLNIVLYNGIERKYIPYRVFFQNLILPDEPKK